MPLTTEQMVDTLKLYLKNAGKIDNIQVNITPTTYDDTKQTEARVQLDQITNLDTTDIELGNYIYMHGFWKAKEPEYQFQGPNPDDPACIIICDAERQSIKYSRAGITQQAMYDILKSLLKFKSTAQPPDNQTQNLRDLITPILKRLDVLEKIAESLFKPQIETKR